MQIAPWPAPPYRMLQPQLCFPGASTSPETRPARGVSGWASATVKPSAASTKQSGGPLPTATGTLFTIRANPSPRHRPPPPPPSRQGARFLLARSPASRLELNSIENSPRPRSTPPSAETREALGSASCFPVSATPYVKRPGLGSPLCRPPAATVTSSFPIPVQGGNHQKRSCGCNQRFSMPSPAPSPNGEASCSAERLSPLVNQSRIGGAHAKACGAFDRPKLTHGSWRNDQSAAGGHEAEQQRAQPSLTRLRVSTSAQIQRHALSGPRRAGWRRWPADTPGAPDIIWHMAMCTNDFAINMMEDVV